MDIAFHYFAVKAVAMVSGYSEPDAQKIAGYSQFVDDFDRYLNMWFTDMPPYLRDKKFVTKPTPIVGKYWTLNPVSTGFVNAFDSAFVSLARHQKWIITPYHFIPPVPLNTLPDNSDYQTQRAIDCDGSVISGLLHEARLDYMAARNAGNSDECGYQLIRIGALLHTFADTQAHERFSGFQFWRNDARVFSATNLKDGSNITARYKEYENLPAVGHANVSHAPDDTFAMFDIVFPKTREDKDIGKRDVHHVRGNITAFLNMARDISDYLRSCIGKLPLFETDWDVFADKLRYCFKNGNSNPADLIRLYNQKFPDGNFHYNAKDYYPQDNDAVSFKYDENFFKFNYYCDITRTKAVGEEFVPLL
jgi:hypothetical protein